MQDTHTHAGDTRWKWGVDESQGQLDVPNAPAEGGN